MQILFEIYNIREAVDFFENRVKYKLIVAKDNQYLFNSDEYGTKNMQSH